MRMRIAWLLLVLATQPGCARLLYNYGAVEPGQIYRSAQPSPLMLRYIMWREPELRSIVNLRGRTPGYESAFAAEHGLRLFSFDFSSRRPPSDAEVERLLEILGDPENQPLLLHCRNGVERTGYSVGLHRVHTNGWTRERALAEMRRYIQFEWWNAVPVEVVRDDLRGDP